LGLEYGIIHQETGDYNLVPRAFSSFKMVYWRNPWPRLLKYYKNLGVFCHVTHDEMAFSEVVSSIWWPFLFSAIWNRCSRDRILTNFWGHFGSLGQGCLRSAILNKEKALGTRLLGIDTQGVSNGIKPGYKSWAHTTS